MVLMYIMFCSFFGYMAGACAQGMMNSFKKDCIVLTFLLASFYFGAALVGYIARNPL